MFVTAEQFLTSQYRARMRRNILVALRLLCIPRVLAAVRRCGVQVTAPGHSLSTTPAGEMELHASAPPPHCSLTQHNDELMAPLNGEKGRGASGQAGITASSQKRDSLGCENVNKY